MFRSPTQAPPTSHDLIRFDSVPQQSSPYALIDLNSPQPGPTDLLTAPHSPPQSPIASGFPDFLSGSPASSVGTSVVHEEDNEEDQDEDQDGRFTTILCVQIAVIEEGRGVDGTFVLSASTSEIQSISLIQGNAEHICATSTSQIKIFGDVTFRVSFIEGCTSKMQVNVADLHSINVYKMALELPQKNHELLQESTKTVLLQALKENGLDLLRNAGIAKDANQQLVWMTAIESHEASKAECTQDDLTLLLQLRVPLGEKSAVQTRSDTKKQCIGFAFPFNGCKEFSSLDEDDAVPISIPDNADNAEQMTFLQYEWKRCSNDEEAKTVKIHTRWPVKTTTTKLKVKIGGRENQRATTVSRTFFMLHSEFCPNDGGSGSGSYICPYILNLNLLGHVEVVIWRFENGAWVSTSQRHVLSYMEGLRIYANQRLTLECETYEKIHIVSTSPEP
jgi:hypothetical protein